MKIKSHARPSVLAGWLLAVVGATVVPITYHSGNAGKQLAHPATEQVTGIAPVNSSPFSQAALVDEKDQPFPSDMGCTARPAYRHCPDGKPGREVTLTLKRGKLHGNATIEVECEGRTETTLFANAEAVSQLSVRPSHST